jgi:hypothetical protein
MLWILGIAIVSLLGIVFMLYSWGRDLENQMEYLKFLNEIEKQKNILEDLQLATSSQLISELKTRQLKTRQLKTRQSGQVVVLSYSQGGTVIQSTNMSCGERLYMLNKAYNMAKEEFARKKEEQKNSDFFGFGA